MMRFVYGGSFVVRGPIAWVAMAVAALGFGHWQYINWRMEENLSRWNAQEGDQRLRYETVSVIHASGNGWSIGLIKPSISLRCDEAAADAAKNAPKGAAQPSGECRLIDWTAERMTVVVENPLFHPEQWGENWARQAEAGVGFLQRIHMLVMPHKATVNIAGNHTEIYDREKRMLTLKNSYRSGEKCRVDLLDSGRRSVDWRGWVHGMSYRIDCAGEGMKAHVALQDGQELPLLTAKALSWQYEQRLDERKGKPYIEGRMEIKGEDMLYAEGIWETLDEKMRAAAAEPTELTDTETGFEMPIVDLGQHGMDVAFSFHAPIDPARITAEDTMHFRLEKADILGETFESGISFGFERQDVEGGAKRDRFQIGAMQKLSTAYVTKMRDAIYREVDKELEGYETERLKKEPGFTPMEPAKRQAAALHLANLMTPRLDSWDRSELNAEIIGYLGDKPAMHSLKPQLATMNLDWKTALYGVNLSFEGRADPAGGPVGQGRLVCENCPSMLADLTGYGQRLTQSMRYIEGRSGVSPVTPEVTAEKAALLPKLLQPLADTAQSTAERWVVLFDSGADGRMTLNGRPLEAWKGYMDQSMGALLKTPEPSAP